MDAAAFKAIFGRADDQPLSDIGRLSAPPLLSQSGLHPFGTPV